MTTFSDILLNLRRQSKSKPATLPKNECTTYRGSVCTICPLIQSNYNDELRIKNEAIREFWRMHRLDGKPESIIASPLSRRYRTNSKRRAFVTDNRVLLGLTGMDDEGKIKPLDVRQCGIERLLHSGIYAYVQQWLSSEASYMFARALNYVILRGDDRRITVLLSVRDEDNRIKRDCTLLSKSLSREFPMVVGFLLIKDEYSKYYMSDKAVSDPTALQKIFGERDVVQDVGEQQFTHSVLGFSQTNPSVLPDFIATVHDLISPQPHHTLYDLYCGYGLFGLSLAPNVEKVIGVEMSRHSVDSARTNALRMKITNARFHIGDLSGLTLEPMLKKQKTPFIAVLDPPRSGTAPGVIETLAMAKPDRVVHVFCDIERLPYELKRWRQGGYRAAHVIPVDMFPATGNVEVAVLLEP
ncbi:methyltransferase domain-containing protein [bacterium]|nr:methyltransferase domain-containing protein [bacterium]NUN46261.1 class I SAM-dependent RNA methyltransferase [bacterium]